VEYQHAGQEEALFSVGESVKVKGGFAEVIAGEALCVAGEVRAERGSNLSMFSGRVTITDSEVRLPSEAADCMVTAHGRSKVYLSLGIRMCDITADGETIVYVPGGPPGQVVGCEEAVMTRGLYSCNIYLHEEAHIEYF
jgi:fructose-1,6-bisphosphatase/inositol monophosphatase family enzyme